MIPSSTSMFIPFLTALATALVAASGFVAAQGGFGAGDLHAMGVWSTPLAAAAAFAVSRVARLRTRHPLSAAALAPATGAAVGLVWTLFASLLLGGWIFAFSFPVALCWILGGTASGLVVVGPQTRWGWVAAVGMAAVIVAGCAQLYRRASMPEVSVDVVLKPNATHAEIDTVWTTVLGRPGRRPGEFALLKEFSSVSTVSADGASPVVQVQFWNDVAAEERDSIMAMIRKSPLVHTVRPSAVQSPDAMR